MTDQGNEQLYRRLIEEVFNRGNLDAVDDLVDPDCIEHQASAGGNGPEGVRRVATFLRTAFPDFSLTIEDLAVSGDRVWARQRGGGTNLGAFLGRPPTGRKAHIEVFDVVRMKGGKIVEHWGVPDQLGMLVQLGHVTLPGRAASSVRA